MELNASQPSRLARLGVYGFDAAEPVVLAALVTEDPLLLIGPSGTGKTYLLNSLSEALGLAHRHYNASLISFDDLVGFPYPEADGEGVRFLETPATVWGAESVLIDEISRCKPEHQNRLFSLVHERRVQGIPLPKLRWRWAAMNPCSTDQAGTQDYIGSEPLDSALADRFALFVNAADWEELTEGERELIVDPAGEGLVTSNDGALRQEVDTWRAAFEQQLERCPGAVTRYAIAATSTLNAGKLRISPRRARLLARSLLAATIVTGGTNERLFRRVLECSLPHACWGEHPAKEAILAAHRAAWDSVVDAAEAWVHAFLAERRLERKLALLLDRAPSPDAGSQAIAQCLANESKERAAVFAFVLYPAAVLGKLPIGAEGVNDLGRVAAPILTVDGDVTWQERLRTPSTLPESFSRFAKTLAALEGARRERAFQFFCWCAVEGVHPARPAELEKQMHACVELLRERGLA
jgi:MoxR-like ATPase